MSNYTESKKELDKISAKYSCAGDVIMRTAVQYVVEYGQYMYRDEEFIADQLQQINDRHDVAEKQGKALFVTREFDLAIFNCARELAEIPTYDLIIFMQKEMYWSSEGGLDYSRAIELLEKCMVWMEQQSDETSVNYEVFQDCDFDDLELEMFRFGYLIPEYDDIKDEVE